MTCHHHLLQLMREREEDVQYLYKERESWLLRSRGCYGEQEASPVIVAISECRSSDDPRPAAVTVT